MTKTLVPSVDRRLSALIEVNRQKDAKIDPFHKPQPVVTISREFGCEAFAVAEALRERLEKKTGRPWLLLEKELLDRLASEHGADSGIFDRLGDRTPFFDDMLSVLSHHWKSHKDYYRVLCRQIFALAAQGDVIFVGRGTSVLLGKRENCFHFRLVAPMEFKIRSIAKRLALEPAAAEQLVLEKQEQREAFIRDFLTADLTDPCLYHLLFNNSRNSAERMADIAAGYIEKG